MDPKLEAEKICNVIEDLSGKNLSSRDDLFRIIEIALSNNNFPVLEELSFQAKFSQGLLRIIRQKDSTVDEKYFETVKTEYNESIRKVQSILGELIEGGNDFIKNIFTEKYLLLSLDSLSNLNNLCGDLNFLKIYLNELKRSDK